MGRRHQKGGVVDIDTYDANGLGEEDDLYKKTLAALRELNAPSDFADLGYFTYKNKVSIASENGKPIAIRMVGEMDSDDNDPTFELVHPSSKRELFVPSDPTLPGGSRLKKKTRRSKRNTRNTKRRKLRNLTTRRR